MPLPMYDGKAGTVNTHIKPSLDISDMTNYVCCLPVVARQQDMLPWPRLRVTAGRYEEWSA